MTITKLSIANGALRLMKEGSLTQSELTNNSREPARLFNSIWDEGGLDACLEAGQWKFAKRTVMLDSTSSVGPTDDFVGFQYVFEKPTDLVRLCGIWGNAIQSAPLSDYREESGFWVANVDPLYVSYVSNDATFGGDYSLWPQSYLAFVKAHFAVEMVGSLTSQGEELTKYRDRQLRRALAIDGMNDPTRQLPVGNWIGSRRNNSISGEN